jgi:hypothetical protein
MNDKLAALRASLTAMGAAADSPDGPGPGAGQPARDERRS